MRAVRRACGFARGLRAHAWGIGGLLAVAKEGQPMPATHNPDHFRHLADQMVSDLQMRTIDLCHAATDADRKRIAAEAAQIASAIARHLAIALEREAPF